METYAKVVNFSLRKYATDEIIVGNVSAITGFAKTEGMKHSQSAGELAAKTIRCGGFYGEYALYEIFTKELHTVIKQSTRDSWGAKKNATLRHRAFQQCCF